MHHTLDTVFKLRTYQFTGYHTRLRPNSCRQARLMSCTIHVAKQHSARSITLARAVYGNYREFSVNDEGSHSQVPVTVCVTLMLSD